MATTLIRAARMITPAGESAGCVVVRDGRIAAVTGRADPGAAQLVELPPDRVLLPGLVDSHVHVNEPGRTEWEGFATATAAAAAGGVTTIVDMPLNSIPPTVDVGALATKRAAAAGQLAVDVAFWGGAVPGNAGELAALNAHGVVGFKCFLLPSGVDEFAPLDADGLDAAMRAIAAFDGLLIAHAEDPAVIAAAPAPQGRRFADFVASRPPEAETRAVAHLIETARRTGCRVHVVHLSSAATLPLIRAAKADGLRVTAETCPHYLTLRAADVPDGATQFKCCPPIRDAANADALWSALLDGTIDCVVSDHSPCTVAAKRLDTGDFGAAWGGIASVQLGLPVVWTEARAPRDRPRPARRVDGDRAGPPHRPHRPRRHRARPPGRPVRLRPGRDVRRRPGPAAAPQPGDPLRRPDAARRGRADVVGWTPGPRWRATGAAGAAMSEWR